MIKSLLGCVLLCLGFSALAGSPPSTDWAKAQLDKLHGVGQQLSYLRLERPDNKKVYHLYVRQPEPEQNTSAKQYPVVYLLDGGITFPLLSSYYHLLHALEDLPDTIIVGISYGTGDWKLGNNRSVDFTAPSKQREHWGGAEKFLSYLQEQIFPAVESKFPVNKQKRILFGNSLGGQFGLYVANHSPQTFYGVIASNPAIHTNTEFYLKPIGPGIKGKTRLFIARAENDAQRFAEPLDKWVKHWGKQSRPPWEVKIQTIPNHGHVSSIPDAFRQGMHWFLTAKQE